MLSNFSNLPNHWKRLWEYYLQPYDGTLIGFLKARPNLIWGVIIGKCFSPSVKRTRDAAKKKIPWSVEKLKLQVCLNKYFQLVCLFYITWKRKKPYYHVFTDYISGTLLENWLSTYDLLLPPSIKGAVIQII